MEPQISEADRKAAQEIAATTYRGDRDHTVQVAEIIAAHHAAERERARRIEEALEEIAEPIPFMRARAEKEGGKLNGQMAVVLSDDANFLKAIAREALKG